MKLTFLKIKNYQQLRKTLTLLYSSVCVQNFFVSVNLFLYSNSEQNFKVKGKAVLVLGLGVHDNP